MKKFVAVLLALMLVLTCVACSGSKSAAETTTAAAETTTAAVETTTAAAETTAAAAETTTAAAGETTAAAKPTLDKNVTIGVSCFSLSAEFPATINEAIASYVKDLGLSDKVKIVSMDAQNDTATQVSQIDNMIAQGVDGIIMLPMDADGCIPCVDAAKKASIPMVVCNGSVNCDVDSCVKSDDTVAGKLEMKALADDMGGKGKIIILHGPNGISAEVLRRKGYEEILKDYPDIKIVAEPSCNWKREEAMSSTENLLQANPDLACVVAENDEMAMGALQAVKDAGAKVLVGGIDAIADAQAAIRSGELACTVFQDAVGQAHGSVDQIISMINGNPGQDIDIPFVLITKDNIDQYFPQ